MNAAGQLQCMYVGKDFLFKILHLTLNVLNKAISFEGFGFGCNSKERLADVIGLGHLSKS